MKNEDTLNLALLKRPIAYLPIVAKAFGSVNLAVMWSQLYYWTDRTNDPDGWIYKTADEMFEETGLTRRKQDGARELGRQLGVIEDDVRGTPPKIHYRIDLKKTLEVIQEYLNSTKTATLFEGEKPAKAVTPKQETPGDFARRFFSGEKTAVEAIEEWLLQQGATLSDPVRREMAKFASHWTEPTKSGKKVRWELEKTFDVKRRLVTWLTNAAKWSKGGSGSQPRGGMRV